MPILNGYTGNKFVSGENLIKNESVMTRKIQKSNFIWIYLLFLMCHDILLEANVLYDFIVRYSHFCICFRNFHLLFYAIMGGVFC